MNRFITSFLSRRRSEDALAHLRETREIEDALTGLPGEPLPEGLKARVLASRAAGARSILPVEDVAVAHRGMPAIGRWAAAAASITLVAAAAMMLGRAPEVQASATAGTLTFSAEMPRSGDTVVVTYRAVAPLAREPRLVLRARLRTPTHQSYGAGVGVHSVATLARDRDGTYWGRMVLPADVVFAAFAVEDTAAARIDDNDGRLWELLTSTDGTTPAFDALNQRAEDLMGRNWEEGHATVRRMIALYPDDQRGWIWLRAFHSWLGLAGEDSIKAMHERRLESVHRRWRDDRSIPPELIGRIYWYARMDDTATWSHWRARLLDEAPTTSFAIQERIRDVMAALETSRDTAQALAALHVLWAEAPYDRAEQVGWAAFGLVRPSSDTSAILLWRDRLVASARDRIEQAQWMAQRLARIPALRQHGIDRLGQEIARLDSLPPTVRPLGMTAERHREEVAATRRRLQASLGSALVAAGRDERGLATLNEAAREGWDLQVLQGARSASLAAGDTAAALMYAARLAADPRSDTAATAEATRLALRTMSADSWRQARADAQREFTTRMLAGSDIKPRRGRSRVKDLSGATHDLATLAGGQVTVVAIWSRYCGPAVDALPKLGAVAERLAASGVRVVGVVEERVPSPELRAFLEARKVTMPTYLDAFSEVSGAFNSWGTPAYYVLDEAGRIRFAATSDADELLARAEAVRLSGVVSAAGR